MSIGHCQQQTRLSSFPFIFLEGGPIIFLRKFSRISFYFYGPIIVVKIEKNQESSIDGNKWYALENSMQSFFLSLLFSDNSNCFFLITRVIFFCNSVFLATRIVTKSCSNYLPSPVFPSLSLPTNEKALMHVYYTFYNYLYIKKRENNSLHTILYQ